MGNKDYTSQRIKHLEMIIGVIDRYADCSARVKNSATLLVWSMFLGILVGSGTTLATLGFSGIKKSVSQLSPQVVVFAGLVVVLFVTLIVAASILICWYHDLMHSRNMEFYCEFYDNVRAQPCHQKPDFCMSLPSYITEGRSSLVGFHQTTPLFYLVLAVYPISLTIVATIIVVGFIGF